jgi:hypothetical protein
MEETIKDILSYLKISDLTGDTAMIAEETGIANIQILLRHFDGLTFTLQRVRSMEPLLVRYLKDKYPDVPYSKNDIRRIARTIGRSPRETYRLMKERLRS